MAKMVRRTCAFCSEGESGSIMYIAEEQNIAAHRDCLVSGFFFGWSLCRGNGEAQKWKSSLPVDFFVTLQWLLSLLFCLG